MLRLLLRRGIFILNLFKGAERILKFIKKFLLIIFCVVFIALFANFAHAEDLKLPWNYGLPFEEYSYFLADRIFTPSKNTKNDLKDFLWVKSDKIIVLHRWIDHLINDNSKGNKENYILFPFPNNPNWFYYILANKIIEKWLCDEVKILKPTWKINETLNDKVKIIKERISDSNLINLYKNAKISIYISDYDRFWFPPLESIFYGTPVIYKNHSCMAEVVWKWGISIDQFDIDKFIDEIKKFDNVDYYNRQQKKWNDQIIQYRQRQQQKYYCIIYNIFIL